MMVQLTTSVLVSVLFPIFIGRVSKHGFSKMTVSLLMAGFIVVTGVTFVTVHVGVDIQVQATRFVNRLFVRHQYYNHNYLDPSCNVSMNDVQTTQTAFMELNKVMLERYIPFLVSGLLSSIYVFARAKVPGLVFTLFYLWTALFPVFVAQHGVDSKQKFVSREREVFDATHSVISTSSHRRSYGNTATDDTFLEHLHTSYAEHGWHFEKLLHEQSALYLAVTTLISIALVMSLTKQSVPNDLRITVMSMYILNLRALGQYVADFGDFAKYFSELQSALPNNIEFQQRESYITDPLDWNGASFSRGSAVELSKVSFQYPGCQSVLRDVECTFRAGENVFVQGLNGAGKSTFLHLLAHKYRPNHGTI